MLPSQPRCEANFTPYDLKSVDDTGEFEGYASLFNREDLGHDVVLSGAYTRTLATRGVDGIRMLFQHNSAEPIGVWEDLHEDARGLYCKGRLAPNVSKARDVLGLMRAGAIDGLSIGYRPTRARRDAASGIRRISEIDLWEISVVTFPMAPGARISAVKTRPFASRTPTPREFEHWLMRDAGLSRSEARAVIGEGLKGLMAKRDAGHDPAGDAALIAKIQTATRLLQPGRTLRA
jgi:uncharacterized protein